LTCVNALFGAVGRCLWSSSLSNRPNQCRDQHRYQSAWLGVVVDERWDPLGAVDHHRRHPNALPTRRAGLWSGKIDTRLG
jgi:hypothetical protein